MKFIDELDIERVNQTLNFETSDCKITGSCDIFTTKPVASDKKLYKTIDHHLETILQENESYKAALQQQKISNEGSDVLGSPASESSDHNRRDSVSFWEQKRRMSITEPFNSNANNNSFNNLNGQYFKSSKLNEQNLKELVMSSDSGHMSPSSVESLPHDRKMSRTSSSSTIKSNKQKSHSLSQARRPSLNDSNLKINIGPFGPINEPASRRTFAYLIAILNASYPDHDFSLLEPNDFTRSSLKSFISKFENSLYSLGKQPEEVVWDVINSHMTLADCKVYLYNPAKSFLEDEPGYLWSIMGFLFNKKRKRVAFIYLICSRLKNTMSNGISVDFENYDFSANPKRKLVIDYDDPLENEYDLTNDENAIVDESDDEFLIN
ncbi:hypothetical protein KAFR_0F02580 [Kazachstania africana CBS 2517]|uniref:Repressor of RNA polymerase III transcription MAF1 n=1 Tax=Kazachstania africana (strain ATCC 22294 / BCRC 22015 / CBS 2517 / CECT 1963 / NBRC 1671 / NRRL Y-8276) TaxID=1071382 RepID=H2AWV5_KAZAF|nr:hypothetical protein KAFR_0F02580 [Kazachstania africana CBS 2517]CCF58855.1 hypothetical protein KAFR_0F02580 [Kazachstania africana CBS 2517]